MSKVALHFDRADRADNKMFLRAITADDVYAALYEISQNVFRPARKHGYNDHVITALLAKSPDEASELIGELERLFFTILADNNVHLEHYE